MSAAFRSAFSLSGLGERAGERAPELSNVLFLLFSWFSLALLNAVAGLDAFRPADIGRYIVTAAVLLTAAACFALRSSTTREQLLPLTYLSFVALQCAQVLTLTPVRAGQTLIFALVQLSIVSLPALLQLWGPLPQIAAALCAAIAGLVVWTSISPLYGLGTAALIAAAAPLTLYASIGSQRSGQAAVARLETEGLKLLSQSENASLAERAWSVALLQATMFAVLIFLDFAFAGPAFLGNVYFKLYSLVLIIIASLLYTVIRPSQLPAAVAFTTVLVGLVLSFGELGRPEPTIIRTALPLVYLALTTSALPWSLTKQILVAWGLLGANLVVRLVPSTLDFPQAFADLGRSLQHYRSELFLVLVGVGASIVLARALQYRRLKNYVQHYERATAALPEERAPAEPLTRPCTDALGLARTEKLISGLFVLGVLSCFASTILLLRLDARWYPGAAFGWLLFFSVWGMLVYAYRRESALRPMWSFAAFIAVVLICWPSILIVYGEHRSYLWLFWPAFLVVGIGFVPWGIRELAPIFAVAVITGIQIESSLHLGAAPSIVFIVASLLSILLSVRSSRLLQDQCLVHEFKEILADVSSPRDVIRALADHLCSCCRSSTAVLTTGGSDSELLRLAKVFPLPAELDPLKNLSADSRSFDSTGVRLRHLNWLGSELALFDPRFGIFAPQHGLLIELDPERGQAPRFAAVLVERDFPAVPFVRSSEAGLARVLSAMAVMKLDTFREQQLRLESERRSEIAQAEREYELGTLVHDINNTVQDLTVLCESMVEDVGAGTSPDGDFTAQIERIAAIARSMAAVVSDAKRKRELERIVELTPREAVDVPAVVKEIVAFSSVRAERKRIVVALSLKEIVEPVWVKISAREHLETILRNLLNNAVTYSDPGSNVVVELAVESSDVCVKVSDNGPGLAPDECDAIFRSGFRGRAGANIPGGLGLGLAQSRRVAEAAGGSLTAFSAGLGKGSTFTLILPRCELPTEKQPEAAWALMVDDQTPLTDFYGKIAKALRLDPGVATSVPEALRLIEERGRPAFVLTDIHLGNANGLELVEHLRRAYGTALPILVVSGVGDTDIAGKARLAGATDFVSKPIGRQALFARIQSLLVSN